MWIEDAPNVGRIRGHLISENVCRLVEIKALLKLFITQDVSIPLDDRGQRSLQCTRQNLPWAGSNLDLTSTVRYPNLHVTRCRNKIKTRRGFNIQSGMCTWIRKRWQEVSKRATTSRKTENHHFSDNHDSSYPQAHACFLFPPSRFPGTQTFTSITQ